MVSFIGFHGNEEQKIEKACEKGEFHYSTGNGHWLGNGTYFFEDTPEGNGMKHAEAWNQKQRHLKSAIVQACINADEENLCDLTDEETLAIIEKLKEKYIARMIMLTKKKPIDGYIDGLFFNMWDTIVKKPRIDVIRRKDYYQTRADQLLKIKSRTPNVYVLCVRNKERISEPKRI